MKVTDEMVDRFLSWRLPITAMPDACVMDRSHDRMGTHVLSFTEAKAMLEHVLAGCDESKSWHSETGWVIVTERDGSIVYFSGSLLIPSDDPLRAVRFARQEDAERIRAALVAGELVASHMDAEERARRTVVTNWLNSRVEEHEWCGPSEVHKPGTDWPDVYDHCGKCGEIVAKEDAASHKCTSEGDV